METQRLRQLEAIARLKTVSAAAADMHMSQSALSRSIARLEQELSSPLLDRKGKHVCLNAAGRVVVEYAHQILREERLMRAELDRLSLRSATLVIGSVAPAPLRFLVQRILDLDGECLVSTRALGKDDAERAVIDGRVDLAVGLEKARLPVVEDRHLMRERLFVALPEEHRLSCTSALSFDELDGETFLLQAHVGFWGRLVQEKMPHSTFIVQENRGEYLALARSAKAITFVSDCATDMSEFCGRKAVLLADESARVSYRLLMSSDATGLARTLFETLPSDLTAEVSRVLASHKTFDGRVQPTDQSSKGPEPRPCGSGHK